MNESVRSDMAKSVGYVRRYKDDLLKAMKASRLIPCEGSDEEVARFLDMSCGIDYISVSHESKLARGVGCRFQVDVPYNTFTIRKERDSGACTEFEKRKLAIQRGGLYPYLTLHAYVDSERDCIDRLAIAKTEEIIDYCEHCSPPVKHTGIGLVGQASFYIIDWDVYKTSKRAIYIWHNERDDAK